MMRRSVLLDVALWVTLAQTTPYQRRYNTSIATTTTQLPPPPPGYGCSGCVVQALAPLTVSLAQEELSSWTSVVQQVKCLTRYISHYTGTPSALQTVVTEIETLTQHTIFTDASHQIITYTTPVLTVEPTPGVTLELPSGTYIFYDKIFGGLNQLTTYPGRPQNPETAIYLPPYPAPTAPGHALFRLQEVGGYPTCAADVKTFEDAMPTRTADWRSFYHSVTGTLPDPGVITPLPLPSPLLGYFNRDPGIRSSFHGINLFSCTPIHESTIGGGIQFSTAPYYSAPHPSSEGVIPIKPSFATGPSKSQTYIQTTYQSVTSYSSVHGPLRGDISYTTTPKQTLVQNSPGDADRGSPNPAKPNRPGGGQVVSIGTKTYDIHPATPSNQGQGSNLGQGVVVGTVTLNPGATTTIDNVIVAVPTEGGGRVVVVGTNLYHVLPTGSPVISVGDAILMPNSHGLYVIGTQTLTPGGPIITVNGYNLSLNPEGSLVVINGVTQTLGGSPLVTGAPVLTVDDQTYPATLIDGTIAFILGHGQTLLPGTTLTISGTTYYLPSDASPSVIVINGVISTLGIAPLIPAPEITLAGRTYTATVRDGTTEYVLDQGTTLRPGDVVTISGTTYSLDALNTALVINGQTSTVARSSVPASNFATPTASAEITAGGKFVETSAAGSSSKGSARSVRKGGLDVWLEGCVLGVASWLVMLL
ncbi:hypothetical protein PSPO01_10168 [Paraphaeosphaeria sporulosa]